jgi:alpha-L-fucosidase
VYGSSPAPAQTNANNAGTGGHHVAEAFNERNRRELNAADVRYVTKGRDLYAFSMGINAEKVTFAELGLSSAQQPGKIANVELLGHAKKLTWSQEAAALTVDVPMDKPARHALAFRVTLA